MKTQLTAEQSVELINRGVSPDKASIHPLCIARKHNVPIFTLADLLEILPKKIEVDTCRCSLSIWQHEAHYWIVSYIQYSGSEITMQPVSKNAVELIDALYELVLWCIDNKLFKL